MLSLHRLIYTSYRKNACDQDEVKLILEKSFNFNSERKISGILIYSDYRFFQYLEGIESDILELYEKIKKDDCHTSVNQRLFDKIDRRAFPEWNMAALDLDGQRISFDTAVQDYTKVKIRNLVLSDEEIADEGFKILKRFVMANTEMIMHQKKRKAN